MNFSVKRVHSRFDTATAIQHHEISFFHFVFFKICLLLLEMRAWAIVYCTIPLNTFQLNTQLRTFWRYYESNSVYKGFIKMRWHVITNIKMCVFFAVELKKCTNVWHNVKLYVVSRVTIRAVQRKRGKLFKCYYTYIDTIPGFSLLNGEKSLLGLLAINQRIHDPIFISFKSCKLTNRAYLHVR